MNFLASLQTLIWFGILGYTCWRYNERGNLDLLLSKFSDRLAYFYLIIGIPVWFVLSIILSMFSGEQSFFYQDSQGFSWPNGGVVLIWNIFTLGIAYYITSKNN